MKRPPMTFFEADRRRAAAVRAAWKLLLGNWLEDVVDLLADGLRWVDRKRRRLDG